MHSKIMLLLIPKYANNCQSNFDDILNMKPLNLFFGYKFDFVYVKTNWKI